MQQNYSEIYCPLFLLTLDNRINWSIFLKRRIKILYEWYKKFVTFALFNWYSTYLFFTTGSSMQSQIDFIGITKSCTFIKKMILRLFTIQRVSELRKERLGKSANHWVSLDFWGVEKSNVRSYIFQDNNVHVMLIHFHCSPYET